MMMRRQAATTVRGAVAATAASTRLYQLREWSMSTAAAAVATAAPPARTRASYAFGRCRVQRPQQLRRPLSASAVKMPVGGTAPVHARPMPSAGGAAAAALAGMAFVGIIFQGSGFSAAPTKQEQLQLVALVPTLKGALDGGSATQTKGALMALTSALGTGNTAAADVLGNFGAPEEVTRAMVQHADQVDVQRAAIAAVCALVVGSVRNRKRLLQAGAADLVAQAVSAFPADAAVQEAGAAALGVLGVTLAHQ